MSIQYIEPLSKAISRTKLALFHPLDLKKWFVVGFAAFLALLADVGFPGGGGGSGFRNRSKFDLEKTLYFPQRAWEWLTGHPGWALLIAIGIFIVFVIGLILTWVSARGKFMFLYNVALDRAQIKVPWYEYRKEANSFFLFSVLWGFLVLLLVMAYSFYCIISLQTLYGRTGNGTALIVPAILAGLGFLLITAVTYFIFMLFRDFVTALMYRDRTTIGAASQKFFAIFSSQPFHFIGYGLFLLCIMIIIGIGVLIIGCVTCCIGFLILAIPYINAVVLLPVHYALRAFSLEFLEQFGAQYAVFPRPDMNPPDSQPVTA